MVRALTPGAGGRSRAQPAFGMLVALAALAGCRAPLPYGAPKAGPVHGAAVPLELAQRLALGKARELWGAVAAGPALPCADDDGELVATTFTFAIGAGAFPAQEEVLAGVLRGRRIREEGFGSLDEGEKQQVRQEVARRRGLLAAAGSSTPAASTAAPDDASALDEAAVRLGEGLAIGADRFGTVVVSARYDRFPIPFYARYLPPYFYQGDVALLRASALLDGRGPHLDRIYFLERERAQYFELSWNGRTALLNAFSLEARSPESVLRERGRRAATLPEARARIDAEWARLARDLQERARPASDAP
jgi:hypothetical protein